MNHIPKTASEAETMLDDLRAELARRQAAQKSLEIRRQQSEAEVAKLTEQARVGKLRDPASLTEAIRRQATLQGESTLDVDGVMAQIANMENDLQRLKREDAQRAYEAAVVAYAKACAPLPTLAQNIRDLAPAAGIMLTEHNSPHLLGRHVVIGSAVVDIPRG